MDVAEVLPFYFELKLSEGLDERHALNVTHCATQLFTHNISSDISFNTCFDNILYKYKRTKNEECQSMWHF